MVRSSHGTVAGGARWHDRPADRAVPATYSVRRTPGRRGFDAMVDRGKGSTSVVSSCGSSLQPI